MLTTRSFASDNNAPVHQEVLDAIISANTGDAVAYGDDAITRRAESLFRQQFGEESEVFFVFNGTGANVSALSHLTHPYHAIICAETSHIQHDECGAPEKFTGCKLHTLKAPDGKIRPQQVLPLLHSVGFQHHAQPKIISLTQSTELGTVYSISELQEMAQFAHANQMLLHIDGARIANAAAFLGVSFREMITDTGVDVLSFGGTKNGILLGEAVVFLKKGLAHNFQYVRKQSMQLASKMRYISAQFEALFTNKLWLRNASHANQMAQLLALKVQLLPGVKITQPVQTNGVFATIPQHAIEKLQNRYFFYVWDNQRSEVRWMTSFCTTPEDIDNFVNALKESLQD